jgi:hypothetical protein
MKRRHAIELVCATQQDNDPFAHPVFHNVAAEQFVSVIVWLERQHPPRRPHARRGLHGNVAKIRADIDHDIAGSECTQERVQIQSFLSAAETDVRSEAVAHIDVKRHVIFDRNPPHFATPARMQAFPELPRAGQSVPPAKRIEQHISQRPMHGRHGFVERL